MCRLRGRLAIRASAARLLATCLFGMVVVVVVVALVGPALCQGQLHCQRHQLACAVAGSLQVGVGRGRDEEEARGA